MHSAMRNFEALQRPRYLQLDLEVASEVLASSVMINAKLIFILSISVSVSEANNHKVECDLVHKNGNTRGMICYHIGKDGRALDEVFRQDPLWSNNIHEARHYSIHEIANQITSLTVQWPTGNVSITKNGLSELGNLTDLIISGDNPCCYQLDIQADEFEITPYLTGLSLSGIWMTENTMHALSKFVARPMPTQVVQYRKWKFLHIQNCKPTKTVLEIISQAHDLGVLELEDMPNDHPNPESIFTRTASALDTVRISKWNISKITRHMFKGMRNLVMLSWTDSDLLEIDAGAFDDLTNLRMLWLTNNRIRHLPSGLFEKTRKLEKLYLSGNALENSLSRANFTHLVHANEFELII